MDWLCWEKNIHPNIEASPKWLDWASFVFANTKIGCVSSKTVKNLMYNKMKDWKWCLWLPAYARDHGNHPFAEGLVWVRFVIFTLLCHLLQCWEGYGAVWKHRFWSLSLSLHGHSQQLFSFLFTPVWLYNRPIRKLSRSPCQLRHWFWAPKDLKGTEPKNTSSDVSPGSLSRS